MRWVLCISPIGFINLKFTDNHSKVHHLIQATIQHIITLRRKFKGPPVDSAPLYVKSSIQHIYMSEVFFCGLISLWLFRFLGFFSSKYSLVYGIVISFPHNQNHVVKNHYVKALYSLSPNREGNDRRKRQNHLTRK